MTPETATESVDGRVTAAAAVPTTASETPPAARAAEEREERLREYLEQRDGKP